MDSKEGTIDLLSVCQNGLWQHGVVKLASPSSCESTPDMKASHLFPFKSFLRAPIVLKKGVPREFLGNPLFFSTLFLWKRNK